MITATATEILSDDDDVYGSTSEFSDSITASDDDDGDDEGDDDDNGDDDDGDDDDGASGKASGSQRIDDIPHSTVVAQNFPVVAQNFPNPANPSTEIGYQLAEATDVSLAIYNIKGQRVRTLVNRVEGAGYYQVTWDGRDDTGREVASGVYLYRFASKALVETRRMVLIR